MERDTHRHLGDGIYGQDLGHTIKFYTVRENGEHLLYFDGPTLWEALRWLRLRGRIPDEALNQLLAYTPNEPGEES